jgi:Cu-Zn family superoxide dismutase
MNTPMLRFIPYVLVAAAAVSVGCARRDEGPESPQGGTTPDAAIATIEPKSGSTTTGTATFTAEGDKVEFRLDVTGAPPGEHAVHIHENADCSAPDAMSAGRHWNPTQAAHGRWGQPPYHLGDIGNMKVGDDGRGSMSFSTDRWTLATGAMDDVVGHAVVIHTLPDNFTTQPDGAAGIRIGCGVIRQR